MIHSRRTLVLAALVAVVAGGVWLATRGVEPAEDAGAVEHDTLVAGPGGREAASRAALERRAPDTRAAPPARVAEKASEATPASPSSAPPADALWVDGRIVFPLDTPADEELTVIARGRRFPGADRRRTHEVTPAHDGTFRIAFAPDTRRGSLRLNGRYLYLEESMSVDPHRIDEVLIEPLLGGRLEVTVRLPAGVDATLFEDVRVHAYVWDHHSGGSPATREQTEHQGGVFALDAVPAGGTVNLSTTTEELGDAEEQLAGLLPGETRTVELVLTRGVRIAGRIEDGRGEPVTHAVLELSTIGEGGSSQSTMMGGQSDEGGAFELSGLSPGEMTLRATRSGLVSAVLELGSLADGEERTGLVLRLDEGAVLAGVVRWPDGRPAVAARVTAQQTKEEGSRGFLRFDSDDASATTDGEGRFRITGLAPRACTVRARARPEPQGTEPVAGESLLERRRRERLARDQPWWHAALEDVTPGPPLNLVLRPGEVLRGRVVNDAGDALERFRVRATEVTEDSPADVFGFEGSGQRFSESFASPDGSFALEGVPAGEWDVTVSARGHTAPAPVRVRTPQSGALTLTIARDASLSGLVVDPSGTPVPRARVVAGKTEEGGWFDETTETRTDAAGTFTLTLAPGEVELRASAPGFGGNEPLPVVVAAAEHRKELKLVLRPPARIEGVLDPGLGVVAGREVNLNELDGPGYETMTSNATGGFAFEALTAGRYQLSVDALPSEGEDEESDLSYLDAAAELTVELAEGQELQVVLGGPPADPVRAHGRVLRGGSPVAGLRLMWTHDESQASRSTKTDDGGRYELLVDGPGDYTVMLGDSWGDAVHEGVTVSGNARDVARDFELHAGRIAGRVIAADGGAAGDALVFVRSEGAAALYTQRHVECASDGTFVARNLAPGKYQVSAGSSPWQFFDGGVHHGSVTRGGLELAEGAVIEGLELRLTRPSTVHGTVRARDGSARKNGMVIARDGTSGPPGPWSTTWIDPRGRYVLRGLGPGRYELSVDGGPEVEVRVLEGGTYDADLVAGDE